MTITFPIEKRIPLGIRFFYSMVICTWNRRTPSAARLELGSQHFPPSRRARPCKAGKFPY